MKIKSKDNLEIAANGISLGKGTAIIKMKHGALRVLAPAVGLGADRSVVDNSSELDAPISLFVANEDIKEEMVKKKKRQARKTAKRKEE